MLGTKTLGTGTNEQFGLKKKMWTHFVAAMWLSGAWSGAAAKRPMSSVAELQAGAHSGLWAMGHRPYCTEYISSRKILACCDIAKDHSALALGPASSCMCPRLGYRGRGRD
jgi:hypothetical protein